jgi:hypothetical protein
MGMLPIDSLINLISYSKAAKRYISEDVSRSSFISYLLSLLFFWEALLLAIDLASDLFDDEFLNYYGYYTFLVSFLLFFLLISLLDYDIYECLWFFYDNCYFYE